MSILENTRDIGTKNEKIASHYLKKNNFTIIKNNYYCPYGEIDIIAKKHNTLYFIEIKSSKTNSDEILFINHNELESYFSITRSSKQIKINWQYGNPAIMETFCTYIQGLINDQKKNENPFERIFIYTSNGKIQDVKFFESQGGKNMILLNPLAVLKIMDNKKVNIYETLPLAETGNAFGKVDV